MTPPAATAAGRTAAPAPRIPRRISGPAHPAPRAVPAPPPLGLRVADRVRALPDAPLLDRLIQGRFWIGLVAVALLGIVFMQVSLLELNAGIGVDVKRAQELERMNAGLRGQVSRLESGGRIQEAAGGLGLVMPAPDGFRYLTAGRPEDARVAARAIKPPDPVEQLAPVTQVASTTAPVPAATTAATPVTATTTAPAATAPAPVAATTPSRGARGRARAGRAGPGSRRAALMALVERRIGFLFGAFLVLLIIAFLRAGYLAAVKGDRLSSTASSQQVATTVIPARRGAILDRNGVALAVSDPADDVSATPYLVKDPVRTAERLAPILAPPGRPDPPQARPQEHGLRLPGARGAVLAGRQGAQARARGHRPHAAQQAQLPARVARLPGAGHGGHGRRRPVRDRVPARPHPARARRAPAHRARRPGPVHVGARRGDRAPGQQARPHARRRDPGQGRKRPGEDRQRLPPEGRHRDRHGPAQQRDPRPGQLAAGRRQRPARGAAIRPAEPRGGLQLRAGVDVQGLHGRGRAAGRDGQPEHVLRPAADDQALRPGDRRGPRARPRPADDARDPGPVQQRRLDQDRPADGQEALRPLGPAVRLRPPDRGGPARRGARPAAEGRRSTRARRWATCRSARASR